MALALLLWGFGEGLFLYIQPLYIERLGANPVQIGGLLSAASVVTALTFLPAGMLADRLPRKGLMLGGWLLGGLAALLAGAARTWQGLIPALLLYAASAYCIPVINAYLAHAVKGRNLERIFTTVFAGYTVGGVISPTVGGMLAERTTMRTVYFVAAALFALSALVLVRVSPQPAATRPDGRRGWASVLDRRFLRFGALTCLVFLAMYLGFPLAPNFLADVRGWDVGHVGLLGSFQALGMTLLTLLLGRLGDRRHAGALIAGQALVWCSAWLLLRAAAVPALALAYLLRGGYQGCRSLTQARATVLGGEAERGLLLGATEMTISAAQVAAPYVAGWLYAADPARPLQASLALIPIGIILTFVALPRG